MLVEVLESIIIVIKVPVSISGRPTWTVQGPTGHHSETMKRKWISFNIRLCCRIQCNWFWYSIDFGTGKITDCELCYSRCKCYWNEGKWFDPDWTNRNLEVADLTHCSRSHWRLKFVTKLGEPFIEQKLFSYKYEHDWVHSTSFISSISSRDKY